MELAIVLITVEPTVERNVLDELRDIPGIVEAHFLYGPYDIYVKVESKSTHELQNVIIDQIRSIKGIKSTMTCFFAD
jgi:DNA-binding Lrp family transcriptional regulator